MPQILVADVIFAARLQSLDFVKNYVAKVQIFPETTKLFGNYFSKICKIFKYSFIQIRQEGFGIVQNLYYRIIIYYNI